ncbi:hypothetical protein AVO41_00015 [Thiomicrospira sp. WB1]|nr:hypothetical protein AVO41_00015 [Thiomicrospira sp. WB1]
MCILRVDVVGDFFVQFGDGISTQRQNFTIEQFDHHGAVGRCLHDLVGKDLHAYLCQKEGTVFILQINGAIH